MTTYKITRVYKGGGPKGTDYKHDYLVTRAYYVNAAHTAAVMVTIDQGDIATSQADQPEVWQQLTSCGIVIEAQPTPPYWEQRLFAGHPPVGDQLDAAFKARQKTEAELELALAALHENDFAGAITRIITALAPPADQVAIDARLQEIKNQHPKP